LTDSVNGGSGALPRQAESDPSTMIEVLRGTLTALQADQVLAFLAIAESAAARGARRRLNEVVCVLRRDEAIAGVNSEYPAEVGLVGGRRFWIYRSLLSIRRKTPRP
jgi:hypothetical protein